MEHWALKTGKCRLTVAMRYLAKLVTVFLICAINSVNSANEEIKDFIRNPEFRQALNLLEPTELLRNHATTRALKQYEAGNVTECLEDLATVQKALLTMDQWALKMVDASSKIPAGLLQGNFIELGMYDECIAIKNDTLEIRGQHCMYQVGFSMNGTVVLPMNPTLSICLPASCTAGDIMNILGETINSAINQFNFSVTIPTVICSPVDEKIWDTEFTICFVILVIYIGFLVICTMCELISERFEGCRKSKVLASLTQFSFKRNAASIFNMEVKKGNLPVLHGIRFISMVWVILGHEYVNSMASATVNLLDVFDWIQSDKSLYIFSAPFAVDTFFAISGFLMTYLFLKQMPKQKKFNVPLYYLHRFLRLTPAVIALLVFSIVFVPKIGSGPRWNTSMDILLKDCRKKWWPTLLYVGNFVNKDSMCLTHLWYLNVDMQLFWISPFILYPLYKKPKIGLIVLTLFFLASIIVPACLISIYEYHTESFLDLSNIQNIMDMFLDIYMMTYNRAGPWLVGIYFGYELARNKRKPKKFTVYAGWLLTVGAFVFCIYGTKYFKGPTYEYDAILEAFFTAFSRPIWGFAICWIVYASVHNFAGPITPFLSCKAFLPFSRLSYTIYLVHMVVQSMQAAAFRTPKFFSDYYVWYYYIGDFGISIVVAIFFSLLFESPIIALEKMIFNRKKKTPTESQKDLTINTSSEEVRVDKSKSKY